MKSTVLAAVLGLTLGGLASTGNGPARIGARETVPAGLWHLRVIVYPDGREVVPGAVYPYTIEFYPGELSFVSSIEWPNAVVASGPPSPDGRIGFSTDCTVGSADYFVEGTHLEIVRVVSSHGASTYGGCWPTSPLDEEFEDLLLAVTGYALGNDELVLSISGGGQLRFVAIPATPVAG